MLTLTKILALFLYPLSLGLWFIGLALWGQLRGNRAAAGLYTFIAVFILYFPSTQMGVDMIAAPLEARHPAFAPEELPEADVIVVLGGSVAPEGRYGRMRDLNAATDRLFVAAELWHEKKAPKVLVTGAEPHGPVPESTAMRDILERLGVDRDAIAEEPTGLTTFDNAGAVAQTLTASDTHVLLVTSALHMRRALAQFQAYGFEVTPAPADHRVRRYPAAVPGFLPTIERLDVSTSAIHEWAGYWVYDLLGRFSSQEPTVSDEQ